MIEIAEKDIIALIESEHMDKTALYLQRGRRLSEISTTNLEQYSINMLHRIIGQKADQHDRMLIKWAIAELALRQEIQEQFIVKLNKLCQKIIDRANEDDLAVTCSKSINEYLDGITNKN